MTAPAADPYLPGRPDGDLDVDRYELELDYRVTTNRLQGRAQVYATAVRSTVRVSLELQHRLRVSQVLVDGYRPDRWAHRGDLLVLKLKHEVAPGTPLVIDVRYSGQPGPVRGPWGAVGWEELSDGVIVAGQPDGAPSWFPCHDSPADKALYRFTVTAEAGYEVVANGLLVSRTPRAGRVRWVYEQTAPMAPYLATLQVGRYVRIPTGLREEALVPPRLRGAAAYDLGRQSEMIALFERLFGPYPFATYTVVVTDDDLEIPLEAQGLSVFGANHMDGRRGSERLVAHELAHQWFGNSLTVGLWREIWLHEGFACYAEWLWSEASGGRTADEHARAAHTRLAGLPQDLVIGDPGPDAMFDDRLYKRGALALHALRTWLGDDVFFEVLRTWTGRYRHGTVSTEEFVVCAELVSGRPVAAVLHQWLYERLLPVRV